MSNDPGSYDFRDLMLTKFMEVNGYLAEFNIYAQELRRQDHEVAYFFAKDNLGALNHFFAEIDEFLKLEPFPFKEVVDGTNKYFASPDEAKSWLACMVEITRQAYCTP